MGKLETYLVIAAFALCVVWGVWNGLAYQADDPDRLAAPAADCGRYC